ncbi:uncharacterized protein LOC113750422 [Coffea eugenioides]|uniref:uncharacterized protein LOC113750422 n=1 Tax=Coffea eugenioides TaxID=49369 RepID=UPI000F60E6D5|nr:uncharacterized protein LOC113750422 [Coffea eugenioides]
MRALVWNCQGVGSPLTVPHLREVNNLLSPNLIFLSKTKNKRLVVDRIARGLRFDNSVVVEAMHKSGGMAVMWKEDTKILEVNQTAFTIEVRIEDYEHHCDWWFVGIYASCDAQIRKEQWRVLRDRSRLWGDRFLIAGDFNDIVSNDEKWGGTIREKRSLKDFKDFIDQNKLTDLGYEGHPWTWSNHWEEEGEIRQRLDRCLSSYERVQIFDKTRCQHLDTYASDHSMLFLNTEPHKIEELGKELDAVRGSNPVNKKEVTAEIKKQLKEAYKKEEQFWCQKARIEWLRDGDKNTRYFHAHVKGRRTRNMIRKLQRDDGSWTTNEEEVIAEISDFFRGLFTSGGRSDMTEMLEGIPHSITQDMNTNLTKQVDEDEIKVALFSMQSDKAPGQDGMTPLFFQRFWSTIKGDLIPAIQSFFSSEGFSNLLKKAEERNDIKGLRISRQGPILTHLFFADDSLIFCKANVQQANEIMKILKKYEEASGQLINLEKSSVFFSKNMPMEQKQAVCSSLGGMTEMKKASI